MSYDPEASPAADLATPIYLRAYAVPKARSHDQQQDVRSGPRALDQPSEWSLTFDTETDITPAQQLRLGFYQLRHSDVLVQAGAFYDAASLAVSELETLTAFCASRALAVRTVASLVDEVFYPYLYDLQGLCVGFNLPFDLSRLAIRHGKAGGMMRGGFTFRLSTDPEREHVRVKHIDTVRALIDFAASRQPTPRGMRQRGLFVPPFRGFFLDMRAFAAALTSTAHSLHSLGAYLRIEHPKITTYPDGRSVRHGEPITDDYLAYACRDVQATWECYQELRWRYLALGLSQTPAHRILSEASVAKAFLREMRIRPWRDCQPGFDPDMLGVILSSYYGPRSEVHARRLLHRCLYLDFKSEYPTVAIRQGLWQFAIAQGVDYVDVTDEMQVFLAKAAEELLASLQRPDTWPRLNVLVQVMPEGQLFPVRARYDGKHETTALQPLVNDQPQWFALADCLNARLLGDPERPLRVLTARRFSPLAMQDGLERIRLGEGTIDPYQDDLFRVLIDLRDELKRQRDTTADPSERERLDAEQQALKLAANSAAYGIFLEEIVTDLARRQAVVVYGNGGCFETLSAKLETPGRYWHPLLATLVTAGGRLLLGLAERLAAEQGLAWGMCDTDALTLIWPEGLPEDEFVARVREVQAWFQSLYPYANVGDLLEVEPENEDEGGKLDPPWCWAISDKRYALFGLNTRGKGKRTTYTPVIRKASGHGLGHLEPPYREDLPDRHAPLPVRDVGVSLWQHDVWHRILGAVLAAHFRGGNPDAVRLDTLPTFTQPSVSAYSVATWDIERWFKRYNQARPYREQVRPFGFFSVLHADPETVYLYNARQAMNHPDAVPLPASLHPIAPFSADPMVCAATAFDRDTGRPIPNEALNTYADSLGLYHLHAEAKFAKGEMGAAGFTRRQTVLATSVEFLGKEADRLDRQFYLGADPEAPIYYGSPPEDRKRQHAALIARCSNILSGNWPAPPG